MKSYRDEIAAVRFRMPKAGLGGIAPNASGIAALSLLLVLSLLITSCVSIAYPAAAEEPGKWRLVWQDEFITDGSPDPEKWNHEILPPGTYNRELQSYTARPENSRVEDGVLIIEAHPIPGTTRGYSSARITTRFSMQMLYGRLEVRARLPEAVGTWPAIWLLPVSSAGRTGWPHSGEIDIMEHVGYDPGNVHHSVHTSKYNWPNRNHHTDITYLPTAMEEFHIYALEWTEESLDFYIDDRLVSRYENEGSGWEAWPFDVPFYLILNVAVGGEWGGAQGVNRDEYPTRMEVDFVRVYEAR